MSLSITTGVSFREGVYYITAPLRDQVFKVRATLDRAPIFLDSAGEHELRGRTVTVYPPVSGLDPMLVSHYNIVTVPLPNGGASLYLYIPPSRRLEAEEIFKSLDTCFQGLAPEDAPLESRIQFCLDIHTGITELKASVAVHLSTVESELRKLGALDLKTGESYEQGCRKKESMEAEKKSKLGAVDSLTGKIDALAGTAIPVLQRTIDNLAGDLHRLHRHVSGWLRRHRDRIIKEKNAQKGAFESELALRRQEMTDSIVAKMRIQSEIVVLEAKIQVLGNEIHRIDAERLQLTAESVEYREAASTMDSLIVGSDFLRERFQVAEERLRAGRLSFRDVQMLAANLERLKQRFFEQDDG